MAVVANNKKKKNCVWGGLKIIDYKDEKGNKEQIKKQPVFVCMNISTTFTACEG
jgi:hypothetical protein